MAVPSVIFVAGCLLVAIPVRRSPDQGAVSTASLAPAAVPLPGDDRAGVEAGDPPPAQRYWMDLIEAAQPVRVRASTQDGAVGWLISDLADPFALEVHRPIEIAARTVSFCSPGLTRPHAEDPRPRLPSSLGASAPGYGQDDPRGSDPTGPLSGHGDGPTFQPRKGPERYQR